MNIIKLLSLGFIEIVISAFIIYFTESIIIEKNSKYF